MSWLKMDAVMETKGLTLTEFSVLMALAYHHNHTTNRCNPSYESIASYARCSRATVHTTLARLKEKGFITWETIGVGKRDKYNAYVVHLSTSKRRTLFTEQSPTGEYDKVQLASEQSPTGVKTKSNSWTVTGFDNKEEEQGHHQQTDAADDGQLRSIEKNKSKNEVKNMSMEGAKLTIKLWNQEEGLKAFNCPKKYFEGDYPPKGLFAYLVERSSESDWFEIFGQVLVEYRNSEFLRRGGDSGLLNSLSYLLQNEGAFMESVLTGKYRDKQKKEGKRVISENVHGEKAVENTKKAGFGVLVPKPQVDTNN